MDVKSKLDSILKRIEKPARYIGKEQNMCTKQIGDKTTRFAFAFPDVYEIGMSYLGLQILYHALNKDEDVYCERVFSPGVDMEVLMRTENVPLFTLETKTDVNEMDFFGFTLQYELSYTNILNLLSLGNIPFLREDRESARQTITRADEESACQIANNTESIGTIGGVDEKKEYPIIIAGGPCAFNPEPLADIVDIFLVGDGEHLLPELFKLHRLCKEKGETRENFYKKATELQGVYVPKFYKPIYEKCQKPQEFEERQNNSACQNSVNIENASEEEEKENLDSDENQAKERKKFGKLIGFEKLWEGAPDKVLRAIISDIEDAMYPEKPLVPLIETVHDRAVVETFRGCTRGCRFCQAGMIYRPVRERNKETILKKAKAQLENTGHDELSLLSLSTSDYSDFEGLATELMGYCKASDVSLSLPSLRLDSFSFKVLEEIQGYKKSGLTFAPEAGTQRLRDVINKGITEEHIFSAVTQAIELGWRNVKLYFMIGLPTETYEDLDGICDIAEKIVGIWKDVNGRGRFNITVSVSNFVPKSNTPFQWAPQDTFEQFREKQFYLKDKLRKLKCVTFNYHGAETSVIEALFSRGDRRIGKLLLKAYELGCKFDEWSEFFKYEKWQQAISESGIDNEFYITRSREYDELFPWDIVNSGVSKEFLIKECKEALQEKVTVDCRVNCQNCGINRYTQCKWGGVTNGK